MITPKISPSDAAIFLQDSCDGKVGSYYQATAACFEKITYRLSLVVSDRIPTYPADYGVRFLESKALVGSAQQHDAATRRLPDTNSG